MTAELKGFNTLWFAGSHTKHIVSAASVLVLSSVWFCSDQLQISLAWRDFQVVSPLAASASETMRLPAPSGMSPSLLTVQLSM